MMEILMSYKQFNREKVIYVTHLNLYSVHSVYLKKITK